MLEVYGGDVARPRPDCADFHRLPAINDGRRRWHRPADPADDSPQNQEPMLETSLYSPVKGFLEGLGFAVKGEIGGCDLLALSADSPPIVVICELKLQFNLELVLQGVDRMAASDEVWLAACMSVRGKGRETDARFRNLCRRLGLGPPWRLLERPGACPPQPDGFGATSGSATPFKIDRRTSPPPGRPCRRRRFACPDHDGLSPGGTGMCCCPRRRPEAAARSEARHAECAQDPAAQRVHLVRPHGSRRLRADRFRPRSIATLASELIRQNLRSRRNCPQVRPGFFLPSPIIGSPRVPAREPSPRIIHQRWPRYGYFALSPARGGAAQCRQAR